MKALLREFWLSPLTLGILVLLLAALVSLFAVGLAYQRADFERRIDASALRSLDQMRKDLDIVRLQNVKAIEDRKAIKEVIDPLKGISKAVERIKEAIEP